MPFYRAIVRHDDGSAHDVVIVTESYVHLVDDTRAVLAQRNLKQAELQRSENGEKWATLETVYATH